MALKSSQFALGVLVSAACAVVGGLQAVAADDPHPLAMDADDRPMVEAMAQAGHAGAIMGWLGYGVWLERQKGNGEPSQELQNKIQDAADTINSPRLSAMLAAKDLLGYWPTSWIDDALPRLIERANSGDPRAVSLACRVVALPSETMGVPADFCRQAVRMGMPDAAYAFAVILHARPDDFDGGLESRLAETLGVHQSRSDAVGLYRLAAKAGHPQAQGRLAGLMAVGAGMGRDDVEARRLASLSAEQGNVEGRAVLGLLLVQGRGGGVEIERGMTLLTTAARSGNRVAQMTLAHIAMTKLEYAVAARWLALSELSQRGDPPADEVDALLLEPMQDTRRAVWNLRNARLDLTARKQAVELREELARSGEWLLVDGISQSYAASPQR